MIAERPAPKVEEAPVEDGLFAGLSFPSVPSGPVVLNQWKTEKPSVVPPAIEMKDMREVKDISTTAPVSTVVTDSAMSATANGSKWKSGSLSTLYATEIITSDASHLYPELPSLTTSRPNVMNPRYEEENVSELSSLLGNRQPTTVSTLPAAANSRISSNATTEDASLLNDLIRENSRLAEEVANLKGILQVPEAAAPRSSSRQATMNQQQQQQQQMQPAPQTQATVMSTAPPAAATTTPSTGVKIDSMEMSSPPKQGVKYVCCGRCRQWLLAPKESIYVVCVSCEAINNCNLTTRQTLQPMNNALTTPAPVTTRWPWFMDCFNPPVDPQAMQR